MDRYKNQGTERGNDLIKNNNISSHLVEVLGNLSIIYSFSSQHKNVICLILFKVLAKIL